MAEKKKKNESNVYNEHDKEKDENMVKLANNLQDYHIKKMEESEYKEMQSGDRLNYMQSLKTYRELLESFPIVFMYTIQMNMYTENAFKKYLKKIRLYPPKKSKDLYRNRASYVKYLFKDIYPSLGKKELRKIWKDIFQELCKEEEKDKKDFEESKARIEKQNKQAAEERKQELFDLLTQRKNAS